MKIAISQIRSLLAVMIYPFHVAIFAVMVLILGTSNSFRNLQDQTIGLWARLSLFFFGVKVEVEGLDRLPQGGYLVLFNHTSNFDILAVQSLIPRIRFGAKIELFSIPLFGHAMKASKALPIARSNRDEVMRVYEQAKDRLLGGECFALSPEGTRQTVEVLAPFKAGPFLFAIDAQVPVVPLAITGALSIQPKGQWLPNSKLWSSTIRVVVGQPIQTLGMGADAKKELQKKVYQSLRELGLN